MSQADVVLLEWAEDAAVMREFAQSRAWTVLLKHIQRAYDSELGVVMSTTDMNRLLTSRGAAAAWTHIGALPDNIITEERRLRAEKESR